MTATHIHRRWRTVSATLIRETIGESLTRIRDEDRVTDRDLGRVLGKSADRARAYRRAESGMSLDSFLFGCREWDGRFANAGLGLVGMKLVPIEAEAASDQSCVTTILRLAFDLSAELERDGDIADADLERLRSTIERVGRVVDGYRERLRTSAIAGVRPLLPHARDDPPEPPP